MSSGEKYNVQNIAVQGIEVQNQRRTNGARKMKDWIMGMVGVGVVMTGICVGAKADDATEGRIPAIPFEKYTLDNGLDVILHEDHSIPVVAVNIWYKASSANEKPGKTGFAHLFEHLMFNGSKHWENDYFVPIQEAGGQVNGSTSQERTNYWENVPSNYLERALWMESDRMGWLLPAMTQEKLDTQRDVVSNERRQSYENRPYGLVYETILAALYPPEHPYSWPTIGSMEDLQRATWNDIADFFQRYYHPANASLCIAGDFDPAEAKRLVEQYFGVIPAGPAVEPLKPWSVTLSESKRIAMTDRVGLPALIMVWPTVEAYSDEEAALDLGGNILGGDDTSRLYRKLVRETQLATSVSVGQSSGQLAGMMMVYILARPDADLAEIERIVREEITKISTESPSPEEIERTLNRYETGVIGSLEPVGGFGGRADMLNRYNVQRGDPGYLANDMRRYLDVTPDQIRDTMAKYLAKADLVLTVLPCESGAIPTIEPDPRVSAALAREKLATGEHAVAVKEIKIPEDESRLRLPGPTAQPAFDLPEFQHATLPSGMKVLLVEQHKLPLVDISLTFPYGGATIPEGLEGIGGLMVDVWTQGTTSRDAESLADEIAQLGTSIDASSSWNSTILGTGTLKRQLGPVLAIFDDVARNPAFMDEEFERERQQKLAGLQQMLQDPSSLAGLAKDAVVYGASHPCARSANFESIPKIQRSDLVAHYERVVRPEEATLIVVGDVTMEELIATLPESFKTWKRGGKAPQVEIPTMPEPKPTRIVLIDRPGSPQSVIGFAVAGGDRMAPDYYAKTLFNSIYGGQFSSRLNMNLREDKGYTYGARSSFAWAPNVPALFSTNSSVHTDVTAAAVTEMMEEFDALRSGERPVTEKEQTFNQQYIALGWPAKFETLGAFTGSLQLLTEYGLDDDWFERMIPEILAVRPDEVQAAAQSLDRDHVTIVVVGDSAAIEESLRQLPYGDVERMTFNPRLELVPETATGSGSTDESTDEGTDES